MIEHMLNYLTPSSEKMTLLFYLLAAFAAFLAFLLLAAGRLVGGTLDSDGHHLYEMDDDERRTHLQNLDPPEGIFQSIGRAINGTGDNVQEIAAVGLGIVVAVTGAVAFKEAYSTGVRGTVVTLCLLVIIFLILFLVGDKKERKASALRTRTILIGITVIFGIAFYGFSNSRVWSLVVVHESNIEGMKGEYIISTGNESFISVKDLLGDDWESHLNEKEDGFKDCGILTPHLGMYEVRQKPEGDKGECEMRLSPFALPEYTFAEAEYKTVADMKLARELKENTYKEKETEVEALKKGEFIDPTHRPEIWKGLGAVALVLGLLMWNRSASEKSKDGHSTDSPAGEERIH